MKKSLLTALLMCLAFGAFLFGGSIKSIAQAAAHFPVLQTESATAVQPAPESVSNFDASGASRWRQTAQLYDCENCPALPGAETRAPKQIHFLKNDPCPRKITKTRKIYPRKSRPMKVRT